MQEVEGEGKQMGDDVNLMRTMINQPTNRIGLKVPTMPVYDGLDLEEEHRSFDVGEERWSQGLRKAQRSCL